MAQIHNRLEWLLGESHAFVDAIYYCPHHPDRGFPGERSHLKFVCECRKPATGLFELAAKELNIDRDRSWMIGDSPADIEAARKFGIPCAFLTNRRIPSSLPLKPDAQFATLLDATSFILSR
jgi:histidinol-phosphate phosphatase family protein